MLLPDLSGNEVKNYLLLYASFITSKLVHEWIYNGISKINLRLAGWKIQNREQNFIIYKVYIHKSVTSPRGCYPHLGTCHSVTLVFVVTRQRMVLPNYVDSCSLHPCALRWCVANQTFILMKRLWLLDARSIV
jgi:hypothetical protein